MNNQVQNELIRLMPVHETEQNLAIDVCRVGNTYYVATILKNGDVQESTKCENLAAVFATVASLLAKNDNTEYFIEQ